MGRAGSVSPNITACPVTLVSLRFVRCNFEIMKTVESGRPRHYSRNSKLRYNLACCKLYLQSTWGAVASKMRDGRWLMDCSRTPPWCCLHLSARSLTPLWRWRLLASRATAARSRPELWMIMVSWCSDVPVTCCLFYRLDHFSVEYAWTTAVLSL